MASPMPFPLPGCDGRLTGNLQVAVPALGFPRLHANLPIDNSHRKCSQSHFLVRETLAGENVELHAVPGAHEDLVLLSPLKAPTSTFIADRFGGDRTEAGRPELVRAHVVEGIEAATHIIKPDFKTSHLDDPVLARFEIASLREDVLTD